MKRIRVTKERLYSEERRQGKASGITTEVQKPKNHGKSEK
jgi:hypothetical protein